MKRVKELILTAVCCTACILLICFSPAAKEGVLHGLTICANILIPSMFPFLVLSHFIALSNVSAALGRLLGPLIHKLFHLPESVTGVVLLALTAGYPTGAVMTGSLLEKQEIDRETAIRLLKFCFNSGLPFAVTAVGTILLGDTKAGCILYASNLLSAVLIGVIDGRRHPANAREYRYTYALNAPDALTESVKKGLAAMLGVCAYVILFGAFASLIEEQATLRQYLLPLLEITMGSTAAAGQIPLPLLAFYTGFGGLCIHLQLGFVLRQVGMRFSSFFRYRLLQGGLSFLFCQLLLLLIPKTQSVFSNLSPTTGKLFSVSIPVTVFMLVMSLVLIIDIDNQKKIC